jgi:hypothetical protein
VEEDAGEPQVEARDCEMDLRRHSRNLMPKGPFRILGGSKPADEVWKVGILVGRLKQIVAPVRVKHGLHTAGHDDHR